MMTPEKQLDSKTSPDVDKADDPSARLCADAYSKSSIKPNESLLGRAYDWASGAADVGAQVVVGAATKAYEAVKDHPFDTAITFAEGAAVGVALVAAAPVVGALGFGAGVVAGVGAVAELAMVGLAADGVASAVEDSVAASHDAANSAEILMHKAEHTQAEIDTARKDVQTKTGDAALQAAGAATMALGFAGSALKAGSKVAAILKSGAEASSDTISGAAALPELTLAGREQPMLAMNKSGEAGRTATVERDAADSPNLPPRVAVVKFSDKIADYIGVRNEKINLPSLQERRANLYMEQQTNPVAKVELQKANERLENELKLRRSGFAEIFNAEKDKLFPGEVVPKIKVEPLSPDSDKLAAYQKGSIFLRDHCLISGDRIERAFDGDRVTENMLHEAKHAEQDALIVRKTIDQELNGDTSGRILSKSEIAKIAKKVFKVDDEQSRAIVEDVNSQRAGRPLTKDELDRAERLEESKFENVKAHFEAIPQEQLALLKETYKEIFESPSSAGKLKAQDLLDEARFDIFGQDNEELYDLKTEYDIMHACGETDVDGEFEKRAELLIKQALLDEIKTAEYKDAHSYDDYRDWFHEREAWAVGEAAARFVPSVTNFEDSLLALFK